MEEILREEEKKKERIKRKDWWITESIVVKILNKELADGKYYKQKGTA
jgi:DNA/RNA-binding protein KIN17